MSSKWVTNKLLRCWDSKSAPCSHASTAGGPSCAMRWRTGLQPRGEPGYAVMRHRRSLAKRVGAGDGFAYDQGVDLLGSFVSEHRFEVVHVPDNWVFQTD